MLGKRLAAIAGSALAVGLAMRRRRVTIPPSLAGRIDEVLLPPDLLVATYARGREGGSPVLLVHSVNAAASAAEMRPLFERLSADRRVVAVDLPGYGRSSRPSIRYSRDLMARAIVTVLDRLGEPADLVALSLGCEFAARAALDRPHLVRSVTMISPTGMQSDQDRSFSVPWLGNLIRAPLAGDLLFTALTTRPSIRYYLGKSFVGPLDGDLARHAHRAARHPTARFAPASFLDGSLFTRRAVETLYEPLTMPVLLLADEDPYTDFGALEGLVARRGTWEHQRLSPNRGLPHFDAPEATTAAIRAFVDR